MRSRTRGLRRLDATLLAGWLFADLLLGLMVVFMASTPGAPPPTPTPTRTPTNTPIPTSTTGPSPTHTPTKTMTPTVMPTMTRTPTVTQTPTAKSTATEIPSQTPRPTYTFAPTYTPYPTPVPVFQSGVEKTPTVVTISADLAKLAAGDPAEEQRVIGLLHQAFDHYNNNRRAGIILTEVNVASGDRPVRLQGLTAASKVSSLLATQLSSIFGDAAHVEFFNVDTSRIGKIDISVYLLLQPP